MRGLVGLLLRGKNLRDPAVREKYGMLGGAAGVAVNLLVCVLELVVGAVTRSVAIAADAFHNLTDVASAGFSMFSFHFANKPADKEHPFGHGRFEYLSALLVALVVMLIGLEFLKTSVGKILHPVPVTFKLVPLLLVFASIPLKLLLSRFNRRLGDAIGSQTLEASSVDALSDVLVLGVASLSLALAALAPNLHADGWIGSVVALFILYSGFSIARGAFNPLLGEAPDPQLVKNIREGVLAAQYVTGVHDLIIHNYGPGRSMASIHAEVPCDVPVLRLHESIDDAEKALSERLNLILVIHMDPVNTDDEAVNAARKFVLGVARGFPEVESIHDFRMIGDETHANLVFDAVVTQAVRTPRDVSSFKSRLAEEIARRHPGFNAVVNVDRNYTE